RVAGDFRGHGQVSAGVREVVARHTAVALLDSGVQKPVSGSDGMLVQTDSVAMVAPQEGCMRLAVILTGLLAAAGASAADPFASDNRARHGRVGGNRHPPPIAQTVSSPSLCTPH